MILVGVWGAVITRSKALASLLGLGLLFIAVAVLWPFVQVRFLGQAVTDEFLTQLIRFSGLGGMLAFLLFSLISLELGQRVAVGTGVRETLDSRPCGFERMRNALAVLVAGLMLFFAALVVSIVVASTRILAFSGAEMHNFVLATVLNVALPATVGLLVGFVAATMRGRASSYAVVFVSLLAISPLFQEVVWGFASVYGQAVSDRCFLLAPAVTRLFALTAPDVGWHQDSLYLAPIELSRWTAVFVWSAVLAVWLLLPRNSRYSLALWLLVTTLLVTAWVASSRLDSVPRHDRSYSSVSYGFFYLDNVAATAIPREAGSRAPDGHQTPMSYDLQLDIGRRLDARVTVVMVDRGSAAGTAFTLFRGYRVSRVTDGAGQTLPHIQEGDVVRVAASTDGTYVFEYAGSGWRYYANHQGVFLPATFPWYPWPGVHQYWKTQQPDNPFRMPDEPVSFTVAVESSRPIHSNLGELTSSATAGTSSGLTLVSGNVESRVSGEWRLVGPRPMTEIDQSSVRHATQALVDRVGVAAPQVPEELSVFFSSTMSDPDASFRFPVILDDHAICSATTPAEFLTLQIAVGLILADVPPDPISNDLFLLLRAYLESPDAYLEAFQNKPSTLDAGNGQVDPPSQFEALAWEFATKIRQKGEKAVVGQTLEYLRSPTKLLTPSQFVATL